MLIKKNRVYIIYPVLIYPIYSLHSKLKNDVENIPSSKDMLIFADKTSNLYEMTSNQYRKLLQDNITKSYQKHSTIIYIYIK